MKLQVNAEPNLRTWHAHACIQLAIFPTRGGQKRDIFSSFDSFELSCKIGNAAPIKWHQVASSSIKWPSWPLVLVSPLILAMSHSDQRSLGAVKIRSLAGRSRLLPQPCHGTGQVEVCACNLKRLQ